MSPESDFRELHPVGEDPFNFQFAPGVGKFHLSDCDEQTRTWMRCGEDLLYNAQSQNCIADRDSTVNTRYGQQEDVAVGYNPQKPGRPSHHPTEPPHSKDWLHRRSPLPPTHS